MKRCGFSVLFVLSILIAQAQISDTIKQVLPGAWDVNKYLPLIKEKRVGIFANQTSMIDRIHVVDLLRSLDVNIKVIFGPEHG
ncbi:MAG TPA: DUF1343 domain-containing protein, partial [Chitinophagaceae bacterium]|nr:DUF1343 domain-containing protein [Chitinophagaceae bacterium]